MVGNDELIPAAAAVGAAVAAVNQVGKAMNTVVTETTQGLRSFLGKVCNPAGEELGRLLEDQVGKWRQANAAAIVRSAQAQVEAYFGTAEVHAHPRLVMRVMEEGSWIDDSEVREL